MNSHESQSDIGDQYKEPPLLPRIVSLDIDGNKMLEPGLSYVAIAPTPETPAWVESEILARLGNIAS